MTTKKVFNWRPLDVSTDVLWYEIITKFKKMFSFLENNHRKHQET